LNLQLNIYTCICAFAMENEVMLHEQYQVNYNYFNQIIELKRWHAQLQLQVLSVMIIYVQLFL
jgi:hypothetical protein